MRKGRFRNSGPPQFTICLNFPANPAGGPSGKSQAGMEIAMPCRGGYHPPVRLCNRRLRGARRLGAPSVGATCGRPLIEDAPPRGAGLPGRGTAFFPKESGGKERAGGVPPAPPKNGGSWRQWVVRAGQRPGVHCRPLYWRLRHGRCRAPGGTHRGYPASPKSRCAVPTWPAGPPSAPCLRNTGAAAVAGKRRVKDAAPYVGATCGRPSRAGGALQRKPPWPGRRVLISAG